MPAFDAVISIETAKLVNLANTKKIIRIIEQSYEYKGKSVEKIAKKVIKKSNGRLTIQEVGVSLQTANENLTLCDSSIVSKRKQRRFKKSNKLKFKLASKREVKNYLLRDI